MLKSIPSIISPELLKALAEMGHGDEIVLADAHFPAHRIHKNVIRCDGLKNTDLLEGIMTLFTLDDYSPDNIVMMSPVPGDVADKSVADRYLSAIEKHEKNRQITFIDRFAFYDRAKNAYVIIVSGELAKYSNIILKKGVIT